MSVISTGIHNTIGISSVANNDSVVLAVLVHSSTMYIPTYCTVGPCLPIICHLRHNTRCVLGSSHSWFLQHYPMQCYRTRVLSPTTDPPPHPPPLPFPPPPSLPTRWSPCSCAQQPLLFHTHSHIVENIQFCSLGMCWWKLIIHTSSCSCPVHAFHTCIHSTFHRAIWLSRSLTTTSKGSMITRSLCTSLLPTVWYLSCVYCLCFALSL